MKICYVFQDNYPWDIRVDKIKTSVINAGMEGHILSRNDRRSNCHEILNNIHIHRLPYFRYQLLTNVLNFPAFFSPFWIGTLYRLVKDTPMDLIIVRDLPLTPTAVLVGKLTGCPVLMDMAENYPAMTMDTWEYRGPRPWDYIIRNPEALKYLERKTVPRSDGVLVVSSHSAERVINMGVDRSRIWIVNNTPRLNSDSININDQISRDIKGLSNFIILYVGGLEEPRGLDTVIRALPFIIKMIPAAMFVIVGAGPNEPALKELARSLGVIHNVHFTGWIDNRLVPSIVSAADVCVVPHYVTEHTDTTVPNKIFDYMLQKKPVVATNAKSLEEIILSTGCGKIYSHKDPSDLAETIVSLKDDKLRNQMGRRGYDAVINKYNWNIDEKNLLQAINSFNYL
jgi:glycosyltransferase involved in cell wall biosynthesis